MSIWAQFTCPTPSSPCHMTSHPRGGSCTHSDDLALSCVGDGAVRLISSTSAPRGDPGDSNGRLEVYQDGEWRSVCDFIFSVFEATAVCRQLGYVSAESRSLISEYGRVDREGFPRGSGRIWQGSTSSCSFGNLFIECIRRDRPPSFCDHSDDVAVKCLSSGPSRSGIIIFFSVFGGVAIVAVIVAVSITFYCNYRKYRNSSNCPYPFGCNERLPRATRRARERALRDLGNVGTSHRLEPVTKTTGVISHDKNKPSSSGRKFMTDENSHPSAPAPPQVQQLRAQPYHDNAPPSYDMASAYPLASS